MKPRCPQCKRIIEQVAKCMDDLDSPDPEKRCAAELGLALVTSSKYEPIDGTDRWHNPEDAKRIPAECFPPSELIRDELRERNWTMRDFARLADVPLAVAEQVAAGTKRITEDIAIGLSAAFGTSAELWLNLEKSYRDHLARQAAPSGERGPR